MGATKGVALGAGLLGLVLLSLGAPNACGGTSNDVIGPEGGELVSEDGMFTLEIPPDALTSEVEVSIHEVACDQEGEAACYEVRPEGLAFREPAVATYEASELMSMEHVSLSAKGAMGWQALADQEVDRDEEIVVASVLYLSSFSVQAQ